MVNFPKYTARTFRNLKHPTYGLLSILACALHWLNVIWKKKKMFVCITPKLLLRRYFAPAGTMHFQSGISQWSSPKFILVDSHELYKLCSIWIKYESVPYDRVHTNTKQQKCSQVKMFDDWNFAPEFRLFK